MRSHPLNMDEEVAEVAMCYEPAGVPDAGTAAGCAVRASSSLTAEDLPETAGSAAAPACLEESKLAVLQLKVGRALTDPIPLPGRKELEEELRDQVFYRCYP